MLDDNFPTFFLKPSAENRASQRDLYLSYHGSSPAPAYTLQYIDFTQRDSAHRRNCYAVGLFDAYNPEVLFGEVLVEPEWSSLTLSQDEIRKNGGIPPPPQPIAPLAFSIQLYNPEQQIRVETKGGKWATSDSYEFALPISTFRTPSASHLDRGQSDPASLGSTPKIYFTWRKESKLSKDLTCFMIGRSTDPPDWKKKKRSRNDPDITVALWRNLREMTIYEPNLTRVEVEDPKGLELVLLLSAIVIKDLYLKSKDDLCSMFNVTPLLQEPRSQNDTLGSLDAKRTSTQHGLYEKNTQGLASSSRVQGIGAGRIDCMPGAGSGILTRPDDPRAQWKVEAETAQLKAKIAAEEQAARLAQQRRMKAKEKEDEAERRRLLRIVQEEDRRDRLKRADIDRETERLRRLYGTQSSPPDRRGAFLGVPISHDIPVMSGGNSAVTSAPSPFRPQKKRSMFGLKTSFSEPAVSRSVVRKNSTKW